MSERVYNMSSAPKLDTAKLKQLAIEYWKAEPWNRPVKAISARRGQELKTAVGRIVYVRGYVASEKFIRGRALEEIE